MKTFKLHLIRHGMTAGNLQGLYIGSGTDIPLCDEGRAQLNELKERFEYPQVDTVFSSPLLRAVETANILFPDAKHTFTVHDLREAGFGKFENKPVKELVHDEDFKKWITPGSGYVPEGAEPTDQFHARCAESLMKLFEYMIRMDVTEAACVTHGGVIMSMLSQRAERKTVPVAILRLQIKVLHCCLPVKVGNSLVPIRKKRFRPSSIQVMFLIVLFLPVPPQNLLF
mgnify:CR=1 FL=1